MEVDMAVHRHGLADARADEIRRAIAATVERIVSRGRINAAVELTVAGKGEAGAVGQAKHAKVLRVVGLVRSFSLVVAARRTPREVDECNVFKG